MSAPTVTQGKRLALVIGVNQTCSDILPNLNHALADAEAMAEVLEQVCSFTLFMPPLLAEHASSAKVKKAVLDLKRNRSEDDFLLLYFSGHGQQAYDEIREEIRNTYLGTADFNEQEVEDDPHLHISMHWLRDNLFEKTNAGRVLIILDCCYAEDIRTGPDHSFDKLREQIQYYFDIPGAEVKKRQAGCYISLAAAGYDTPASEQDGHGKMTRLLLKALRGEELALLGDKGQITLDRLLPYIKHEMPAAQKPVISSSDSTGEECVLVSYPDLVPHTHKSSRELVAEQPTTYIPFPHDPLFRERPGEFARLEQLLLPSSSTQKQPIRVGLVGVTGMGGIGKTQLAVEFSYRYRERFPSGIFWMPATGRNLFEWQTEFAKLAFNTGYLPPDDDASSAEHEAKRAQHIARYLADHADALLILDNVEQPELVVSVLPALAGKDVACSILYTSRITAIAPHITLHEVGRLPEGVALLMLLKQTRPEIWADIVAGRASREAVAAKQVCQRVGYLPLALVHLRGRLQQDKRATLGRMAEVLAQSKLTSLKYVLFATFRLSWEHVRDEESRRLFQLACYFPEATPIPLWLLGLAADLGEDASSFEPLGEACLHLQEVSLFEEFEGEQVRLHPLVREFGHLLLAEEQHKEISLTANAIRQLVNAFTNLNALEQHARNKGYWTCLEDVRAARDYASILGNGQITVLERVERWLDRESYLFADEAMWPSRVQGLFYQQFHNRSLEERNSLFTGNPPEQWIEQINHVGAENQALIRMFNGHIDAVTSVVFSSDGRYILTGSFDKTARLWESSSGRHLLTVEGHTDTVSSVAFSSDGRYILTGSSDKTARVWESNSGRHLLTLEGHTNSVMSVAFSPDGRYILTGSSDRTAQLWECSSGRHLLTLEGHTSFVTSVAFSLDGKYMLTGSYDSTARVWESSSGRHLLTLEGHTDTVSSVAFSSDGKYILTGSYDNTARLWESSSGQHVLTLEGHTNWIRSVTFSPDGKQVLTGSDDQTARLWESSSGQHVLTLARYTGFVWSVAFSPDGRQILTGCSDNTVWLWEHSNERLLQTLEENTFFVTSVAFSPDGRQILTGCSDNTARLWESNSGKYLLSLEGHTGTINSVAFSSDGRYILTGSSDKTARLWESNSGKHLLTLEEHTGFLIINSVAFSPDGRYILTGGSDSLVWVWESSSGRHLFTLEGHTNWVYSIAFSPDGRYVLTGSADKTARVWESSSGKHLLTVEGHTDTVSSVAFSPDGKYMLTGCADQTVRLWESSSGRHVLTLEGHTIWVRSVGFSPNGYFIVTCDAKGHVYLWLAQGSDVGRLVGIYKAVYEVGAVFWQDATHLVLADMGGSTGHPFVYELRLHGMEEE